MILLRHCECYDDYPSDPELTTAGQLHAGRLAASVLWDQIDLLVSSPKRRALGTSRPIRDHNGITTKVNDHLREVHPLILTCTDRCDDLVRFEKLLTDFFLPNIFNERMAVVSHMNLLSKLLSVLTGLQTIKWFDNYGKGIVVQNESTGPTIYDFKNSSILFYGKFKL